MNILLATDVGVERAGICIFLLQWIKGIRAWDRLAEVTVYFRKSILDHAFVDDLIRTGVHVEVGGLPEKGTSLQRENRGKVRADIRRLLNEKHYDVLHVNSSAFGFSAIVLSEGVRAGVPIRISHSHGRNLGNGVKWAYLWLLKRYVVQSATAYAGCSLDAGAYMFGKRALRSAKWHFVPNTVSAKRFAFDERNRAEKRGALGIGEECTLLGASGLLVARKNHSFLLDVVRALNQGGCRAKLLVLGEGELRPQLEEKIRALNIEDEIVLYGQTDDVAGWLSAMDVYLMPSLTEGLPIAAVEAQTNGLPCLLSTGVPADVDLSGDVCHLPVDRGPEVWADKIRGMRPKACSERQRGWETIVNAGFDESCTQRYVKELYQEN